MKQFTLIILSALFFSACMELGPDTGEAAEGIHADQVNMELKTGFAGQPEPQKEDRMAKDDPGSGQTAYKNIHYGTCTHQEIKDGCSNANDTEGFTFCDCPESSSDDGDV